MIRARVWGLVLAASLVGASLAAQTGPAFDHQVHAGLFPLCVGCHAGIEEAGAERPFPAPAACATCHDGVDLDTVAYRVPDEDPDNLRFTHPAHARAVADVDEERVACLACHAGDEDGAVRPAPADACLGCHAHAAPSHLAPERSCEACHRPLAEAPELPASRVEALPRPSGHEEPGFLSGHDPGPDPARCAFCHARESCARCHLDPQSVPAIRALPRDARVAALVDGREPAYPVPANHEAGGWRWGHGASASEDPARCGTCHVAESCAACHGGEGVHEALPTLPADDARGAAIAQGLVHPPGFDAGHGTRAAVDECASCHREDFCESCHQGSTTPSFHAPDFLELHGPDAYRSASDCASCHTTEVFCRSCHAALGMGGGNAPGVTFHDARPFWVFGHGAAARQGLEGCASCHAQSDCAACHSSWSGWGVNPHGPGFDGAAARDANPFSCAPCHLGGTPP